MNMVIHPKILSSFSALKHYCEAENFAGWDPYDGLTSPLFRRLPLAPKSAICRLVWIQLFKRNPLNFRRLVGIRKSHNAKGIGLFLSGYCRLYQALNYDPSLSGVVGSKESIRKMVIRLADLLISMRSSSSSGASWGYNFPWQCRREFLFPANEPTVVATFFCATALMEAYEVTSRREYLEVALDASEFVMKDLHRTPYGSGFLFSYSKRSGNDSIINASLLGSALLSRCLKYSPEKDKVVESAAWASVRACIEACSSDGSWTYGLTPATAWIDSFHTGYNLSALGIFSETFHDNSVNETIERGMDYYISTFFMPDGSTKYYHDRRFPVDIHCPGQLPMTLYATGMFSRFKQLAEQVLLYAIHTMQAPEGYFYYQLKRRINSKIPYMRWSNAFMFCSLATFILESVKDNKKDSMAL